MARFLHVRRGVWPDDEPRCREWLKGVDRYDFDVSGQPQPYHDHREEHKLDDAVNEIS